MENIKSSKLTTKYFFTRAVVEEMLKSRDF